jgi:hypothetical protein
MITKLFRNTELKIAYKTKNILRSHLQTKTRAINKYELSGVYHLKCGECPYIYTSDKQDDHSNCNIKNTLERLKTMEEIPNLLCTYRTQGIDAQI